MGDKIIAVLPEGDQRADWYRPGWVCMYNYPFNVGFTLPYLKLSMAVLETLHIAPNHLMPSSWRVMACLNAIEAKHHLKINVDFIKASYILKKYSGCRYTFANVNKDDILILNIDGVNDKGWKGNYLFTEKNTFHKGSENLLEYQNAEGKSFSFSPIF